MAYGKFGFYVAVVHAQELGGRLDRPFSGRAAVGPVSRRLKAQKQTVGNTCNDAWAVRQSVRRYGSEMTSARLRVLTVNSRL